jgi:hypothetical protein
LKELGQIKRDVQNYRLKGQYIAGHEYVCGLPESVRRLKTIAIETAQMYLVQGHYIRAVEACDFAHKTVFLNEDQNEPSPETLDADSICLELLSAYVAISRWCKVKSALRISQRVYEVWLSRKRKEINLCMGQKGTKSLLAWYKQPGLADSPTTNSLAESHMDITAHNSSLVHPATNIESDGETIFSESEV